MFFRNRKWALVLSGGGAKGIAHIGVLKFLDEHKLRPDMIAGTSAGAIIGSFYCCGMTALEIEDFILNDFDYKDYLDIRTLHLPEMTIAKALQFGESMRNLFSRSGVDSGSKIYHKVLELTKEKRFGEEAIPFYCNSVDIINHRQIVHETGKIADAVRASCAVPGFFAPYKVENALLVDGGIYENMPVFIPREKGIKHVVAVNLNAYKPVDINRVKTGAEVMVEAMFISSRIRKREGIDKPDVEIIATDDRPNNDFSNPKELIDLGYGKAIEMSKEIKDLILSPVKKLFLTKL
ncbi:MAG TPA: patatin-like phospholipase family protein [bacterium]|jgi:NTE family protein|nr:patatin-like phospholipase family protein [bacterium]MDX9804455.1 patatin-like phospholipase family protein [bacterium]HNZ52972.1 patatin-like phospholipase family protein [bacterium]HOB71116.1 patatin-like phospholipase family protein [bacterium]HOG42485.1 patatin-like phospholipase family protein [bacterium]